MNVKLYILIWLVLKLVVDSITLILIVNEFKQN